MKEEAKAIHSESTLARESASIPYIWQSLGGRQESGKASQLKRGKAPDLPSALITTVDRGQLQWADWDWGILCACLGVHISLSLDGPDLETGLKIN